MRSLVSILALLTLFGCASIRGTNPTSLISTGTATVVSNTYTVSIVSGDGQSGYAVIQPITINFIPPGSTPPPTPPAHAPSVVLPLPLVVLVTDQSGKPCDGILVNFSDPSTTGPPLYGHAVTGLGTATTGDAVPFNNLNPFPATPGEAAVTAQPYRIGTFPVYCQVDPSAGSSNVVAFFVTGTQ
jgi:hypothetical protein